MMFTESWRRISEAITMLATGETEQERSMIEQNAAYVDYTEEQLLDAFSANQKAEAKLAVVQVQLSQLQKDAQERERVKQIEFETLKTTNQSMQDSIWELEEQCNSLESQLQQANKAILSKDETIQNQKQGIVRIADINDIVRAERDSIRQQLADCQSRESTWTQRLNDATDLIAEKEKVIKSQLIELGRWVDAHAKVFAALREMRGNVVVDPPKQTIYYGEDSADANIATATINGVTYHAPVEGYP